uniref:VWFA domain-containing protein n=1 Tax=Physcomitrium patens TaxID=3218 RepID=A0A2K1I9Y7_PHYPA|nr:hypothetical protein PHYPA_031143 [Physcomitrium patens]
MSINNFGPLQMGRSSYDAVPRGMLWPSLFFDGWSAQGSAGNGKEALAQYTLHEPTEENAHVHMLLDASGSTWEHVKKGDGRRVYEHLFENFAKVVKSKETGFRPHDKICVWSFNRQAKLLFEVEHKDFVAKEDAIKAKYKKQMDVGTDYKETRLYDAVAMAMEKIQDAHKKNKKADFFLVVFTDGVDNKSEKVKLKDMVTSISKLHGRLHTIFITANMPPNTELYKQLEAMKNEIEFIRVENTEASSIARGFNTLRQCIKAFLLLLTTNGNDMTMTRIVHYGANKTEVAGRMVASLADEMRNTSLLEGWYSLRTIGPS